MIKKIITFTVTLMMVLSLAGCSQSASSQTSAYTGEAEGKNNLIKVEVLVNGQKIEKIDILEHSETAGISDAAFEGIPKSIIEKQSLAVDAVAGATLTSKGIIGAVGAALDKAGVEVPQ